MRGRKPTPTKLKIVRGNPARRPINENEPEFEKPEEKPAAPAWLKPDQVQFWDEIAPMLFAADLLTQADYPALSALCIALGELRYANDQLEKGRLIRTPSGYMQQSPFVGMLNSSIKQIRSLVSEFGMTPAARTRVMVMAGMSPEDAFQAFLNRGKKQKA